MKIAVVDIETTGWLNEGGLIVEVGVVLLDLETGETEVLYDELVKEDEFEDAHERCWIFHNSDLEHGDVMKARALDKIKLQAIFDKYLATAYNKKFDFDFLRDRGLKIDDLPCPMILATNVCKVRFPDGNGYKWPSVQEAWDFFFPDSDYIEKHRGMDDAKHEALIVHELHKRGHFVC